MAPVKIALSINPGDSIWARTAVDGGEVSLYITDQTTHQTWSKTLTMTSATPDTSTAEWVAEAPSECAGGATSDCTPLPLANFGKATFSDAYTTSNGHTGSISDSNWTAEAIELEPSSSSLFGGGPGGYLQGGYGGDSADSSYGTTGGSAAPTALSTGGTKFTVDYGAALQSQSAASGQSQSNSSGSAQATAMAMAQAAAMAMAKATAVAMAVATRTAVGTAAMAVATRTAAGTAAMAAAGTAAGVTDNESRGEARHGAPHPVSNGLGALAVRDCPGLHGLGGILHIRRADQFHCLLQRSELRRTGNGPRLVMRLPRRRAYAVNEAASF